MRCMSSADSRAVVVVGSINEDVMLQLGRRIRPGETVTAQRVERGPGGKGANQAAAAAAAGAEVAMLGAVGDDPAGARMVEDLRRHGVNTGLVRTVDGVSTGTAYVTVTPDGENTIVLDPGANAFVDAAAVEAAWPALPPAEGAAVAAGDPARRRDRRRKARRQDGHAPGGDAGARAARSR